MLLSKNDPAALQDRERLLSALSAELVKAKQWLSHCANMQILTVPYADVIANPGKVVAQDLAFPGRAGRVRDGRGGGPCALQTYATLENRIVTSVRIDKWLWAARFFKTRSLSAKACELGRIESNGQPAKASREVHVGDLLQVKNPSGAFQVEVLGLSEMRGPAPIARTLYRETEASQELRLKLAEERKAMPHFEGSREGKPSKRDRRQLGKLRGRT
jgi:ribosome-associated heat shock protein Hsp15